MKINEMFIKGYLEKKADLMDNLMIHPSIGAVIGNSAANPGKGIPGSGVGAMAGVSSAIGSSVGKSVANFLGISSSIPEAVGSIAGLAAFKSIYDKATFGKDPGIFQTDALAKELTDKLDYASSTVSDLPMMSGIKDFYTKNIENPASNAVQKVIETLNTMSL